MITRVLLAAWISAAGAAAGGCGGVVADDSPGAGADAGGGAARAKPDAAAGRGRAAQDGDGGSVACSRGPCPSPADVSGFAPTWRPPTGAHQGRCTPALIDEYYQSCLSIGGAQACDAFGAAADQAHQTCAACISSDFGDRGWAPIVRTAHVVEANSAGCIALLDPGAIDCAKALQALDQCEHAACDPVCGAASATAFDDWDQCTAAANACGCKSWFAASDCIQPITADGGPAAQCLIGQTFEDFFSVAADVFCGN